MRLWPRKRERVIRGLGITYADLVALNESLAAMPDVVTDGHITRRRLAPGAITTTRIPDGSYRGREGFDPAWTPKQVASTS